MMRFLTLTPTQRRQDDIRLPVIHGHVSSTTLLQRFFQHGGAGAFRSYLNRRGGAAAWAAPTLTQQDLQDMLQQGKLQEAQGAVGQQANRVTWLHVSLLEDFMQQFPAKYSRQWGGKGAFQRAIQRCLPCHYWALPQLQQQEGEEEEGGEEEEEQLVDLASADEAAAGDERSSSSAASEEEEEDQDEALSGQVRCSILALPLPLLTPSHTLSLPL
jgi:hypothetical protein